MIKYLAYKIPKVIQQAVAPPTSKDKAETTASGEEKLKVDVDEDGFKIPQGISHRSQKRQEADES